MERLLGFDLQLLQDAAITGINLFILFFALSYLLFNPARKLLDKRRERIDGQISEAKYVEEKARELKKEYDQRLKNIQKEGDQILNHARDLAMENQAKILEDARIEAKLMMDRASHEIALEKKKALEEVKQEMVSISAMMACKAISELLENGLQRELVEATVREIGEQSWQNQ